MAERQLRSGSYSLARDVDEVTLKSERDRAGIEVNDELNSATDKQWEGHDESSNNVVMSASQFREFMNTVMKEFEDLER
jgi:hypothetical protein